MKIPRKLLVRNARELYRGGISVNKISKMMGVNYWVIYRICKKRNFICKLLREYKEIFIQQRKERMEDISISEWAWEKNRYPERLSRIEAMRLL